MTKPMPQLDISPEQWRLVRAILEKHVPEYGVWAFGSRVKGTAKPYSDLDLVIMSASPLPLDITASLKEAFSESNLPWRVDIVDWASISDSFKQVIERDKVLLKNREAPGSDN